jgi:hypothetical protein
MKNVIFLAALVIALIAVFASPAHSDGIILRGGMNFANANTDLVEDEDREFRTGFNAAVLGEIGDGGLRLLAGLGYENRGLGISIGDDDGEVRLDYVTVPVLLSVGTSSMGTGMPRVFVNLGVEPAFLVSEEEELGAFTFDFEEAEKFDFGLRGEAGMEIPLSVSSGIVVGAGYSQSLTDASKSDDTEWKHYGFHLFGGVKIGMF